MSEILTRSECIVILKNSFKDRKFDERWIKGYTVKRVSEGLVGFMGEYYKLNVELENDSLVGDNKLLSFFVKSVPVSNAIFRKECLEKGFFRKETNLYANLLGVLQNYSAKKLYPECYYTRPDLIVLEDLSAQHLRHITTDVSIDFFKVVLKTQAHLHAASIAYELDTGVNIGEQFKDFLFEIHLSMNNAWYVTGIKGVVLLAKMIQKYQNTPTEEFITTKLYDVLCSACNLAEPSDVYRNVLCHSDSWTRNIFVECDKNDKPIDCMMVDFQLTRYNPPAIDVLYLISMATRKKQKQLIADECLEYYYNSFAEVMTAMGLQKEVFSRQDFLKSCHHLELAVLILKAICAPLTEMPAGLGNKFRAEEPERFDYYLNVDRAEMFTRLMDTVPEYKEAIFEPVEEIIEYLRKEYTL